MTTFGFFIGSEQAICLTADASWAQRTQANMPGAQGKHYPKR